MVSRAPPIRIAMWSGPRNISTAMMRAFENRGDCAVCDEPFYAAYLVATGLGHPMREDVDGVAADRLRARWRRRSSARRPRESRSGIRST